MSWTARKHFAEAHVARPTLAATPSPSPPSCSCWWSLSRSCWSQS